MRAAAFLVSVATALGGAFAQSPASPSKPNPPTAPSARPGLFNESADAASEIQAARDKAKAAGQNVLLFWGDNQAKFCHCLNDQLHAGKLKELVETEFQLVFVDIGRFEKNKDLGEHYQTDNLALGVPNLTVIDATTDSVVGVLPGRDVIVKPPIEPACFDANALFKFLDNAKARQPDAAQILADAQAKAKGSGNRIVISFGSRDCAACTAWDRVTTSKEGAAALGKAFVVRRIDLKRNPGAAAMYKKLSGSDAPAGPALWMTVLESDGSPVTGIGKMPNFDPSGSSKPLVEWLYAAAPSKFTPEDQQTVALGLVAPAPGQKK